MPFWSAIVIICCAGMVTGIVTKVLELAAVRRKSGGFGNDEVRLLLQKLESIEQALHQQDQEISGLKSDLDFYRKLLDRSEVR